MSVNKYIRGRTVTSVRVLIAFSTLVFGGVMFGLANTGASAAAKPKVVTLQYWNTYNVADKEGYTMEHVVIPRFEKLNPGIKVHSQHVLYPSLLPKLISPSAAGTPPDVLRSDIAWVAQLAQQGLAVNVGKLKGFAAIKAESLPGPLATTEVNGKYYAFVCEWKTQGVYWNKAP